MRRLACAFVLVLLSEGGARADDESPEKQQARLLLAQGNALFEKGDLKGALADFHAAYALYPSPKLLVNSAACLRELGDLAGAANELRHFLDEAPEDDPLLVDRTRSELKVLERKVGRLGLSGWPPHSTLEVDGRPARDPFYVKPGDHHVKVRGPQGAELERDVSVQAGDSAEVGMPALVAARASKATTPRKRGRWWIGAVVAGSVVAAAAIGVGVGLGTRPEPQPLSGDLGTFEFSDFR